MNIIVFVISLFAFGIVYYGGYQVGKSQERIFWLHMIADLAQHLGRPKKLHDYFEIICKDLIKSRKQRNESTKH